MKDIPVISVVMATHNRAHMLRESVASIFSQSIDDLELIVVDDCSTDNTRDVLDELCRQHEQIQTVHLEKNLGPGMARNKGMAAARGKYIAIMDDDDMAEPERFRRQCAYLNQHPDVMLVFGPVIWVDDDDNLIRIFPGVAQRGDFPNDPKEAFRLLYLEGNKVVNTTIMFRHNLYDGMGGYPDHPWIGEDWCWFMKMAAQGKRIGAMKQPLVRMRRGMSHDNLMQDKQNALAAQRQVLKMIREWLRTEGIHDFDHLHRRAYSNQLVREARFWGRWKGVLLCKHALILSPSNAKAWRTLRELAERGWRKLAERVV